MTELVWPILVTLSNRISWYPLGITEESRSEDDIGFDERNTIDNVSSEINPESPTAEAVAKAFLESVDKYVEYEETDRNHPESTFSPKNGMSGVVYVGQNGNYHHNSNGHPPSGLIEDELESDENLQVLELWKHFQKLSKVLCLWKLPSTLHSLLNILELFI